MTDTPPTSAVYHPSMHIYIYGKYIYIVRLLTPHTLRGVIISESKRPLGVIFDEDHDFKGPRAPKAHLDTVLTKPVTPFRGGMIHVFSQHTHRGGPGAPGARRGPPTLGHFRHFNYILIGRSFRRKTTDTTHNPAIICFRMHDAVCAAPWPPPNTCRLPASHMICSRVLCRVRCFPSK